MSSMKTYLQPLLVFCLSIILFIVSGTFFGKFIRFGISSFYLPLTSVFNQAGRGLSNEIIFWKNLKKITRENTKLEKTITEKDSQIASLKEVKKENEFLKNQLGFSYPVKNNVTLVAGVIGFSGDGDSWITLNRGSDDGISVNDVVTTNGFLIGRVTSVNSNSSRVLSILSPEISVNALDQDSITRTSGVVTGRFNTSLLMEKILPEEIINIGDTIITSGTDGVFPRGLIVGKVGAVFDSSSGTLKSAEIGAPFDFRKLEQVLVLKNK